MHLSASRASLPAQPGSSSLLGMLHSKLHGKGQVSVPSQAELAIDKDQAALQIRSILANTKGKARKK